MISCIAAANARDIVAACISAGSISAASGKMILSEIQNSQARDMITTDPDVTRDRSLSWTFQPMAAAAPSCYWRTLPERKAAEAKISHLARYDELTELPNRVNFRDEIGRLLAGSAGGRSAIRPAVRRPRPVQAGQRHAGASVRRQLLCAVADRLRAMLRPEDFVARFGGDEFVVFSRTSNRARRRPALPGELSTI